MVLQNYEKRVAAPERMTVLRSGSQLSLKEDARQSTATGQQTVDAARSRLDSSVSPVFLLLKSERWSDFLQESKNLWLECSSGGSLQANDSCFALAQARAVALGKLGSLQDALVIHDQLASQRLSSMDALIFASLLADAGRFRLCSQMATTGRQWQPVTTHAELMALSIRCLRLDGQLEAARTQATRGLDEFPAQPPLLLESALLFLSEKSLTRGCDLLERLYLQEFKDVAVFYNWGQCLVGRRDTLSARRVLERGRREWPSERLWILLAGEISYLDGRFHDARQEALDYLANASSVDVFRDQAVRLMQNAQGD